MTTVWGVEWANNGIIENVYADRDVALIDIINDLFHEYFIYSHPSLNPITMEDRTTDLATDVEHLMNYDYIEDVVYLNSMNFHT